MPYEIRGKCIYRSDTGKKVGCTKGDVQKYLKALHANVKEGKNEMKLSSLYKKSLKEDKRYEMVRSGSKMEFRKKSDNGLIGSVELNGNGQLPNSGLLKLSSGISKPFKDKLELHDLVNSPIQEILQSKGTKKSLKEESYKLSKGNKSSKNVFGEEELKTPWATGNTDCCEDYGIQYEEAEKRLSTCKSIDKLDEEYTNIFLQMDNSFDRNNLRLCYYEKRRKLTDWTPPKNDAFKSNIVK